MNNMVFQAISLFAQLKTELISQFNVDPTILCYQSIDDILIEALLPVVAKGMMIPLFHIAILTVIILLYPEYLLASNKLIERIATVAHDWRHKLHHGTSTTRWGLNLFIGFTSLLLVYQCTPDHKIRPLTAEQYLVQFNRFIHNVEQNKSLYDVEDWANADQTYKAYSRTYYAQFSDELSDHQIKLISRYKLKYHACKGANTIDKTLESLEDHFLELQNKINNTINN